MRQSGDALYLRYRYRSSRLRRLNPGKGENKLSRSAVLSSSVSLVEALHSSWMGLDVKENGSTLHGLGLTRCFKPFRGIEQTQTGKENEKKKKTCKISRFASYQICLATYLALILHRSMLLLALSPAALLSRGRGSKDEQDTALSVIIANGDSSLPRRVAARIRRPGSNQTSRQS